MLNALGNICDLARQHHRTGRLPRQIRSATPRTRNEDLPPNSCTNRGDASQGRRPRLVFDSEEGPRFSLFSCMIGCPPEIKVKTVSLDGSVLSFFRDGEQM